MTKSTLKAFFATLPLFMALAAYSEPQTRHLFGLHENHPYGVLTRSHETPHVKWADPYIQGPVKTLVLAPMWTQRETVELAQRLSLDFTPWMCSTYFEVAPAYLEHEARYFFPPAGMLYEHLNAYLAPGSDFDVIVIGKLHWAMLPPESRLALLKKVANGTGLVFVNPPEIDDELDVVFNKFPADDDGAILEGVPLGALPRFEKLTADQLIRVSTFGSGRVVRITYDEPAMVSEDGNAYDGLNFLHSLTPRWVDPDFQSRWTIDHDPLFETFYYDYYHSVVARAVLWAARMEPGVRFAALETAPDFDREELHSASINLVLRRGDSAVEEVRAKISFRNTHGETLAANETTLTFGSAMTVAVKFPFPVLAAGTVFADVWVADVQGKKIINWGSLAFDVNADIAILGLSQTESSIARGDEITGELKTTRPLEKGERLVVCLWDSLGREIVRVQPPPQGVEHSFSMGNADPHVILHELRAAVWRAGEVVTESRHWFPIRKGSDPYDFSSVLWSMPKNDMISHFMLKKLRDEDHGDAIDVSWRGHLLRNRLPRDMKSDRMFPRAVELESKVYNLARADLQIMGYNYRFGVLGGDEKHQLNGPCFTDPEWLASIDEAFARDARVYGPYGPIGWTHGDESFLSEDPDVCWSPSCLAGFRKYLHFAYGDLASLNDSWAGNWKSWDEILPGTFEAARESGNYPPWFDHKCFMNTAFSGLYNRAGAALETGDAGARSGFDGPKGFWWPNGGIDWWQLCKTRGVLQAYNESGELEVFRSFADPRSLRGAWYGSYGDNFSRPTGVKASHYIVWNSLFNQANSSWFWTMGVPGPLSGYAPDLTSLPYFASRTEALREIKSGVGKMILSSRRENDGIAIHYSDASRIADSLAAEKVEEGSKAFVANLRYYRHMLEANGLGYDFVSYEQVERGKLLRDEFRLLILPYSRAISDKEADQIKRFAEAGGMVIADLVPGIMDDHARVRKASSLSELFTAEKSATETPLLEQLSWKSFGKGKAILIGDRSRNCGISVYGFATDFEGRLGPHIEAFRSILSDHTTIRPSVSVTPRAPGNSLPPTVVRRFTEDGVEVVTLLRYFFAENHMAYPSRVTFDRRSHLYDVRNRDYLGFLDAIDTDISHKAHVYAMLPYRVKEVEVSLPQEECRVGESAAVTISIVVEGSGPKATRHCVRIRVIDPDGNEVRHYARNIMTEEGQCTARIRFALNDPPGEYKLMGRDVLSGIEGSRTIELMKGASQ
jgi:hypothetical protein